MKNILELALRRQIHTFHPVVSIDLRKEKMLTLDCGATNPSLTDALIADTEKFSAYIDTLLQSTQSKFAIGGYNEDRVLYRRSKLFDAQAPRSIHLGFDIWGPAGTPVFLPLGGMVHSYAFNNDYGDYGATIIMQHQIDTIPFHTLYGHLSLADLANLHEGKYFNRGEIIGHFGAAAENGDWPPHLHFQIIEDMRVHRGDYPGVCAKNEVEFYLENCPNPDAMLNFS